MWLAIANCAYLKLETGMRRYSLQEYFTDVLSPSSSMLLLFRLLLTRLQASRDSDDNIIIGYKVVQKNYANKSFY